MSEFCVNELCQKLISGGDLCGACDKVRDEEREACAKISDNAGYHEAGRWVSTGKTIAKAIRARGTWRCKNSICGRPIHFDGYCPACEKMRSDVRKACAKIAAASIEEDVNG